MFAIGLRLLGFIVVALLLPTGALKADLPGLDKAPARPSLAGQLLVAAPRMGDPHFQHGVILIVQHSADGALGIVINNPIGEQPLGSLLKALGQDGDDATGAVRVFSGGPVQPEVGFVVHSPDYRRPETVAITDRLSMTSSVAILKDIGDKRGPAKVLVAFGYSGWGPDQLEHEIEAGVWETAVADPTLVFDEDRENVWDLAWRRRIQHSDLEIPRGRIE